MAEQADSLQESILSRVPGEPLQDSTGKYRSDYQYEKILREQSIGELRGLRALQRQIDYELTFLRSEAEKLTTKV